MRKKEERRLVPPFEIVYVVETYSLDLYLLRAFTKKKIVETYIASLTFEEKNVFAND